MYCYVFYCLLHLPPSTVLLYYKTGLILCNFILHLRIDNNVLRGWGRGAGGIEGGVSSRNTEKWGSWGKLYIIAAINNHFISSLPFSLS